MRAPKDIALPPNPCPKCKSEDWHIHRMVDRGGSVRYPLVCGDCGDSTVRYVPKKVAEKLGGPFPEIKPWKERPKCEVCGSEGAQRHHWAPFYLFGAECEKWPTSHLCPTCHKRWHDTVTPHMSQRG
jgi:hypothetical protein